MTTEATAAGGQPFDLEAAIRELDGGSPPDHPHVPAEVAPPEPAPAPTAPEPVAPVQAAPVQQQEEDADPLWGEPDEHGNWRLRKTNEKYLRNKTEHQLDRAFEKAREGINKRNERIRELEEEVQRSRREYAPQVAAPAPVQQQAADPYADRYQAMQGYRWTEPERYDRDLMQLASDQAAERATAQALNQFRSERQQEDAASHAGRISAAGHAAIEYIAEERGLSVEEVTERAAFVLLKLNAHITENNLDRRVLERPETFYEAYNQTFGPSPAKPIVAAPVNGRASEPPGPKRAAAAAPAKPTSSLTERQREDLAILGKGLKDVDGFMNGVADRFASGQ